MTAAPSARGSGAHALQRRARDGAMRRIDNDAQRGECESMSCRNPGDNVRFHIDGSGAGEPAQFAFFSRIGDRRVHADHRSMMSARDGVQKFLGPRSIGRV